VVFDRRDAGFLAEADEFGDRIDPEFLHDGRVVNR
jgi:hypothetical protein